MRKTINRILAVLFIVFIAVIFSGTMIKYGRNYAYGFFKGYKEQLPENPNVFDNIRARIGRLEYNAGQRLFLRNPLREMNAGIQALAGKDMINIGTHYTVRLSSGGYYDLFTGDFGTEKTDELIAFANRLMEEKNIPTLFAYCHCGLYEDGLIDDIYRDFDNNNECADQLLSAFSAGGVPIVDSRQVYRNKALSINQAIMKSDIHWTHRMAFETAAEVVSVMNAEFGWALNEEALVYENFEDVLYEGLLYGEIAQRLGDMRTEEDDIHLLYPKYDTHIVYDAENEGHVHREGSFYEAIIEPEKLELDASGAYQGKKNTSAYYVYGDYLAEMHTVNEAAAPVRALIFKDSYGTPVSSFLSLACREVYALDLRSTELSMEEWVDRVQPDVVIFAYSQQMLRNFDYVIAE